MARNDVYLNINALSPADAVVTGQQDMTAATVPELVLGDTPTFNFYFTDNTNVWPSWAGNASYSLTWALSDAVAGDFAPAATTSVSTPITGGWSVVLPLNSYDLVGLLNTKRVGQPYPVTNLWQQLRVTDPSGNEITRAMFWTPVRYRAISDTQNTESATPTGGRIITTLVSNALQSPTAAQFYAANPVPTSALGTASNGQLLIGNGTGFTKATLTAGTGVSITNGSGSITIDASGAQETLTATVKNAESVAITKGQVVYLFGATGGFASVKLAYNTSDATSAKTFGVVSSTSIAANGTGTVTCVGVVDGLNLGAYNDGDTLYLGATPGSVTATKPYAPNHLVYVGIVERANNGNGELYVRVQNGYELDEIHDVQINTPKLAGQTLIYDQTNDLWKNAKLTGTANQITVTNADAAVTLSIPTNPTLPGNLTVSGTGTSTFGGNLTVGGGANLTSSSLNSYIYDGTGWVWTSTGTSGGTVKGGIYAAGGLLSLTANSSLATNRFSLNSSGDATVAGNLTVSGTGLSSVAGALNVTGALLAHQTAALNMAHEGSSLSQLVSYGADASTYGKLNITLRKAGTGVGAVTALALTSTDATLAGNLIGNGTTNALGGTNTGNSEVLALRGSGTTAQLRIAGAGSDYVKYLAIGFNTTSNYGWIDANQAGTGVKPLVVNPSGGNLLLGTTTDSGNGKLQLATHTTSAGGIGFGTDTSLFRTAAGEVGLDALSGTATVFGLRVAGTRKSYLYWENGTSTLTLAAEAASSSLKFLSANALALTLDSSLNATFAGNVTASKAGTAFYSIESTVNGAVSEVIVKGKNSSGTAREARLGLNKYADDVFSIYDGTTERFRLGLTNGNATITGALAINNTVQTAASVASTHKVTIVIGGVTYYLLATNI